MRFRSLYIVIFSLALLSFVLAQESDGSEPEDGSGVSPTPTQYENESTNWDSGPDPTDDGDDKDDGSPTDDGPIDVTVVDPETDTSEKPGPTGHPNIPGLPSDVVLSDAQYENLKGNCRVLKSVFTALSGNNWVQKNGWTSEDLASCCSWQGVQCNKGGRIKSLDLAQNNLSGKLPAEVSQLNGLLTIDVSNNTLSNILSEITEVTTLISINVANTGITSIPESIGNLVNLQSLHLNANKINVLPNTMSQLTNLKGLYLANNSLGELPAFIYQMNALQVLSLDGNNITGTLPNDIGNLSNLEGLYLSQNHLTGSLPEGLSKCTNLRTLKLKNNKIQSEIPTSYTTLTNLHTLDLSHNKLIGVIPKSIGNLVNLEKLILSDNQLVGQVPDLQNLKALTSLHIQRNHLNGLFPNLPASLNRTNCIALSNKFTCQENVPPSALAKICRADCSAVSKSGGNGAADMLNIMYAIFSLLALAVAF
ncbi:L domain-like protein [Basidiobolus meristosporus CBS 931.73]|uniref:L domain-like protein n=1 Tax=Basidiobolus meristosporus CBS 931.73 TaxID=1314790 RepID=A0A1Y1XX67_9FUNG|nr:L domain-like protein [Basidiobolus meristosporus CBS 931.73]|eukprot:ORX90340.1 L domain-like protein [Basidiobolus meristosporus CBS 931.73]